MKPSLQIIYTNIISLLEKEKDSIFESDYYKSGSYIVLIFSALEFFLSRCFDRIVEYKIIDKHAIDKIQGDLSNNKIQNIELYVSIFTPSHYETIVKTEKWKEIEKYRNNLAHAGCFDKFGQYKYIDSKLLDDYLEYSKQVMQIVMEKVNDEILTITYSN